MQIREVHGVVVVVQTEQLMIDGGVGGSEDRWVQPLQLAGGTGASDVEPTEEAIVVGDMGEHAWVWLESISGADEGQIVGILDLVEEPLLTLSLHELGELILNGVVVELEGEEGDFIVDCVVIIG